MKRAGKQRIFSDTALIAAAMAFSLAASGVISAAQSKDNLENSLVRLHILAASDSSEDQRLKLTVRDALLDSSVKLFEPYSTADEAKAAILSKLQLIEQTAEDVLVANGCTDSVSCELVEMPFDVRTYDDFTVPAGDYTALRVTIGSGEGKNWWCVMYPPLCVPCAAAEMTDEEIMEIYGGELSGEDILLLSEGAEYKPRLYIAELIERLIS